MIFVSSFILNPPHNPKNNIAQIVESKSAITGVPRNSNKGCAGFINGMIEDNVFKIIRNNGSKIMHTISQKFGFLSVAFCSAYFSFSK